MEEDYKIKIPVFEGPLDLLLHLIKESKIDIYDIPIANITRQYLEYLELMKELNLEIAGDFIVMAATLIHIKSRMLLPIEETADTSEPEDPRMELVIKLLEYKAFKDAAIGLKEKEDDWGEVYQRAPLPEDEEGVAEGEEPQEDLSLFDLKLYDLLSAFNKLLERAPAEAKLITKEALNIKDKMALIIEVLKAKSVIRFESLFKHDILLSHYVVTFIALLELIRLGLAKGYQQKEFSSIWIISPEAEGSVESLVIREMGESVAMAGPRIIKPERTRARIIKLDQPLFAVQGEPEECKAPEGRDKAAASEETLPVRERELPGRACELPRKKHPLPARKGIL